MTRSPACHGISFPSRSNGPEFFRPGAQYLPKGRTDTPEITMVRIAFVSPEPEALRGVNRSCIQCHGDSRSLQALVPASAGKR